MPEAVHLSTPASGIADRFGRPLRDLRVSVTDRCNFRCVYCMPKEVYGRDFQFLERAALLSFEEIARLARVFAALGVEKIRLTGGEPLLRRDLAEAGERAARRHHRPPPQTIISSGGTPNWTANGLRRRK